MGTYTFTTLQEFYDFQDRCSPDLIENMSLDSTVNPFTATWDSSDDSEANQIVSDIQNNVTAPSKSFAEISAAIAAVQTNVDNLEIASPASVNAVESNLNSVISAVDTRVVALENKSLTVTKETVYEYMDIWAEESGNISSNSSQWSFGNGATGDIGLAIPDGWQVIGIGFSADNYSATTSVEVECKDFVSGNQIASISLSSATDGGGSTDNARKYVDLTASPAAVPNGAIIGFRTVSRVGFASDGRVNVRLRKTIGDFVTDVTLG